MGGLKKLIPVTYITFLLGALAISGFPLLSGFFSKDEILAHAFEHHPLVWTILFISSLITAFYMFRLVYLTFFNDFRGTEETRHHIHESPWTMTLPLIVLCVLSVIGGLIGLPAVFHVNHWLDTYLAAVTEPSASLLHHGEKLSHALEIGLMSFAGLCAILVIYYAYRKYVTGKAMPESEEELKGLPKLIANKFYVDEVYDSQITRPVFKLSEWFGNFFDKKIVDRIVNVSAGSMNEGGKSLRLFQNGNTGFYVFAMVIGMVVLLIIRLLI
jgi:NADH-quinone oxidoreductase subunit L